MKSTEQKGSRSVGFTAWGVAGSGFVSQFSVFFVLNIVGMTIAYFAPDFGVTVTEAAIVSSAYGVTYGSFGVVWGFVGDKIGLRKTLPICGIGAATFLLLFGLVADSLVMGVILYACAGIFAAGMGTSLMPKLVSSWFAFRWVGKALVLVSVGGTLGGVAIGVIGPWLITNFGWRGCFIGIAIAVYIFSTILAIFVKDYPAKYGLKPFGLADNEEVQEPPKIKAKESGKAFLRVLRMPVTWKMGVIMILIQACIYTNTTFMVSTMTAAGYSIALAGLIFSTHRLSQTLGNVVWSPVSDIFARKYVLAFLGFVTAVIFVMLNVCLVDVDTAVFGVATGFVLIALLGFFKVFVPLYEAQITELYPPDILGTGSGAIVSISMIGRFFGPLIAAQIIDFTGAFNSIWLYNAVCVVLMAVLVLAWIPKTGGKKYGNPYVPIIEQGVAGDKFVVNEQGNKKTEIGGGKHEPSDN